MKLYVENGHPFKICQLTDIHLGNHPLEGDGGPLNGINERTLNRLKSVLEKNEFDLFMITGDLIWGKDNEEPRKDLKSLYNLLNEFDTPVAITYGNHDTEGPFGRDYLRDFENELTHLATKTNVFMSGEKENYTLEVLDQATNEVVNKLFVWDSGLYSRWSEVSQYAAIDLDQINWYVDVSKSYAAETFDIGFMHIPIPEYKMVDREKITGSFGEPVCSPDLNSGLFHEILNQNNIKAMISGHDHFNNFSGSYAGIQLNYGNVTGYNCKSDLIRGVTQYDLYSDGMQRKNLLFEA
ncbi:metallophosphoesterase [Companilactobacillus kimchiensis]|uniref:Phosphohydrolase, Icc family protein n=1 Tax=Companilactobacillus kimchiensis TaxID=993692 RepID=A0A0R2L896_9LACO|nr:metallophosphoesterase [Companilactobacillus kimchiensis]KRN97979.1 phosphohydrolase, Icc family protein [Companilactobacillus kimchiensis]